MKPEETNTAAITPTEAHRSLVADSVNYDHEAGARACAEIRDDFAKLAITSAQLADSNVSLRQERDQLRAALECMTPRYIELFEHAGLGPAEDSIAVEMAREALGLPNIGDQSRAEVERLTNLGIAAAKDGIAHARHAERAETELSTEREKVRALRDALTEIMENSSGWAESTAREALESAENVA